MDRTQNTNFSRNNNDAGFDRPNQQRRKGQKLDRRPRSMPRTQRKRFEKENEIPPIGNNIRIIPLGGVEEVGKNMTAIEIGNDFMRKLYGELSGTNPANIYGCRINKN